MKHLGDITKINGAEIPIVDCITGGSPCQDLSVAGKRAGLDGERSGLFMEQIRIVKEMRAKEIENGRTGQFIRPRFMVWENVPGAFSSNNGKDFQAVLTEIVRIVESDAPDVPMPDNGKWTKSGCIYDELGRWSVAWRLHDAQFWGVPQRRKRIALVADLGGLAAPEVQFERKGLSGDSEPGGTERKGTAEAVGNGVESASGFPLGFRPENVRLYDEKATTICNGTRPGFTCGVVQSASVGVDAHDARYIDTTHADDVVRMDDTTAPLQARDYKGGKLVAYGLDRASYNQGKNAQFGFSIDEEIIGAQTAKGPGAVFDCFVRRLTPLECERLQGFPDGWTDIGEWTDTKGKNHQTADSARYKALGNSIALPFWFYLLRRISAQYERPATLGSLFDGIGGFPLCWERCNGQGTAIWASEIEEFPIAVTKMHFPKRGDAE